MRDVLVPAGATALAVLAVAAAGLAGCDRPPPPPAPEVVAEVADRQVRWADFQTYVENALGDSGDSLGSGVLSQLFDQFLEERLLTLLAVDKGLLPAAAAEGPGRRLAVDVLLADAEATLGEVAPADVEAWYAENRSRFARPPRVRLRQILTNDRAAAEAALEEIRAGADFAAVAERFADHGEGDDAALTGYSLGELSREDLPPAFAEVVLELEPGEVSEVVEAEYGFHLFQVTEKLPAETLPLEEARAEVERELQQRRTDALLADLVAEARRRYDVSVWERNLPFNYRGIHRADAV